jgi:cell division protein FtsB
MTVFEKSGFYLSICIIAVLLFLILFGRHGVLDYHKLKQKEQEVTRQSQAVSGKNQTLVKEIEKLNTDEDYIKHVAKHEYEMAEENEIIIKQKDEK